MAAIASLGEYIREQRETAKISLRELAKSAGVSNPYLSQIERGLRKPSAEILQQIAKGLRISAEVLYVQAGFLEQRDPSPLYDAILADETLTERQKRVLLDVLESFLKENAAAAPAEPAPAAPAPAQPVTPRAKKTAPAKTPAKPTPAPS